ncbi:MAG TPA: prepilin-type N-terminal cleavage/methylation domain-containing protein [Bdellovibrionales bacterium]|nr:prepilin-type N-terminal cleavage/methylation domain-containing protein [Bdellovibrionales bacterium]
MKQGQRGFTLIEVLVAMVIMVGGIVVLANSWGGNFARVKNSRVNNTMAILLERKMTEIEIMYRGKPFEEIKEEDGGDFGPQFPGYRWEMSSQPFEMPDLSGALISREGGATESLLMIVKTIAEFMKEAVREASVTVIYKDRRGTEVKHSVATYFVDYTKELSVPGLPAGGGGAPAGGSGGGGNE